MNIGGVFRSTYMAPEKDQLAGSNIKELANELIEILSLKAYEQ